MLSAGLVGCPLFKGVAKPDLEPLLGCLGLRLQTYKKGEAIWHAGDSVREIGIVSSGCVHVLKLDAWGNSNIIAEIEAGGLFGEAVVFSISGEIPNSVVACEDTEVGFFSFMRLLTTCPSSCAFHSLAIRNMIVAFARKNMMLEEKMEHITKRSTREKLLSYLSSQSRQKQSRKFDISFDRQELADYLSVDRSALSLAMSKLKDEGIILYRKNHFVLLGDANG
ncbi:MAG: Crp/Fnr family transcriptional regulator [Clostridiales bacterium]|jgi:CRP-like cAMP-binding protein|nr:Crp/Fnr family transcriptional regulator [Clostridiales bacterium]MDR2749737.1 Crp/Fnr family transcriptional regulator [Clostridiales bacterium]